MITEAWAGVESDNRREIAGNSNRSIGASMADLTITSTAVIAGTGASVTNGTAGVAVTAGQAAYLDDATGRYLLADNNSATAEARVPDGIILNAAAVGQPVGVLTRGPITIGATLTPGVAYYLGDAAGGICPVADLASGEYPTIIGMATSASVLTVKIQTAGVAL